LISCPASVNRNEKTIKLGIVIGAATDLSVSCRRNPLSVRLSKWVQFDRQRSGNCVGESLAMAFLTQPTASEQEAK
jgi:hypothetical protein